MLSLRRSRTARALNRAFLLVATCWVKSVSGHQPMDNAASTRGSAACTQLAIRCCRVLNRTTLCVLLAAAVGFVLGANSRIHARTAGVRSGLRVQMEADCRGQATIAAVNGSLAAPLQRAAGIRNASNHRQTRPVRIFCWILTSPSNHLKKARHVRDTWARRCDKFIFVSSKNDPTLPAIDLGVPEGYEFLWAKTKAAFRYAYTHHMNDCDFFLKADDDTYVVMENLRRLLQNADPNEAFYAGRRFRRYIKQGFLAGGPGYVLSREALRRFVEYALTEEKNRCRKDDIGAEDVNIAICLTDVGVQVLDTRDKLGRERFHPFPLENHLHPEGFDGSHWIWSFNYYPLRLGTNSCSDTSVSFHYATPGQMQAMEFLIYRLGSAVTDERDSPAQ